MQVLFERDGVGWIYVDTFSLSTRKQNHNRLVKSGKYKFKKRVLRFDKQIAVFAFSRKAIYGVAGSKDTLDSTHFIKFLQNPTNKLSNKF